MSRYIYLSSVLFFGIFLFACQTSGLKRYEVKKIDRPIQLNGNGSDPLWKTANVLTDFTYPWRPESPPATRFSALWDGTYFYFLYRAEDPQIIIPQRGLGEQDAVNSDRVEIFFKADDQMNPYYALEMDALGRMYDTKSSLYRNIDPDWDWPKDDHVLKASIDETGYWLEGALSIASLRELGLYKDDNLLKAGLYRGEYRKMEDGSIDIGWISWIIPDSETPDFHIPSSFGILELAP